MLQRLEASPPADRSNAPASPGSGPRGHGKGWAGRHLACRPSPLDTPLSAALRACRSNGLAGGVAGTHPPRLLGAIAVRAEFRQEARE
jgi:hypothetical protein